MKPNSAPSEVMIDTFSSITNTDTYTQRLIHARGYWFAGTFRGASSQRLTDSTIFDGRRWPMKIRFSGTLGGLHGHDASTGDQGFGIRIDADNNRSFDLTAFTLPVFFVRRAADMVDFFRATKSNTRTGQPDEAKLRRYLQQHPESVPALRLAATKAPSSLAALTYHAVHTFGLSAQGRLTWARLTIEPYAPPQRRIEMQEALSLPANYLQQELESRLPVWFTVFAQLPTETDLLHDPTQPWSGNGGRVKLATIAIESAVSGDDPHSGFDPLNIDTLVPPLDELFADRHALYLMSRRRRSLA